MNLSLATANIIDYWVNFVFPLCSHCVFTAFSLCLLWVSQFLAKKFTVRVWRARVAQVEIKYRNKSAAHLSSRMPIVFVVRLRPRQPESPSFQNHGCFPVWLRVMRACAHDKPSSSFRKYCICKSSAWRRIKSSKTKSSSYQSYEYDRHFVSPIKCKVNFGCMAWHLFLRLMHRLKVKGCRWALFSYSLHCKCTLYNCWR